MPASPSAEPPDAGGIRVGDVGGNVSFRALGDIVGGDKITTIATTIQISVEAVTQRELIPGSPYRGLDRFEDRDAALFFGRDQLIKNLLAQLSASNVLLVLGASGSGKSSVVRAGLLPRLSQLIGARFRYLILVPDVNPSESLRSALQASGFSQAQTRELLDAQPDVPRRLIRQLQREGDQWLLFVDQFEEIFTRSEERLRSGFIAALLKIAQDPAGSIKLVLAMRGDFLDCFTPFPEFAKLVEKNIVLVTDMHVDELRLAIEQPAAKHGIVFRPGLVEEIIKDVQGQAGSLPLLQYTLNQLWQEEARGDGLADRHLEKETYRQLGGVRGALQKRADEIYASFGNGPDSKSESAKQKIVRQIFLRVVDLAGKDSDEAGWRAVRQRVWKALFKNPEEQQVLQKLIDEKLLVSSGRQGVDATVEVAHEALFTSWGRLKEWIEGGKQVIFARNRLADDARRWQSHRLEDRAGAEEELLSGSRLGQALEMRARGDFDTILGGLPETEAQCLDASAALHERRRQEEQERQQRELVQAQALAKEQKQRADDQAKAAARQRRLTMAMVVLFLAAAAAAVFSLVQTNVAHKAEAKAKDTFVQSDFDTALLEQQNSKAVSVPALAHLARALRTSGEARLPRQYLVSLLRDSPWCLPQTEPLRHEDLVWAASFSPDGQRVVTASNDGTARVWDAQSGKPVGEPLRHEDLVRAASFSPDGQRVVTASHDGTARVWDAQSGKPLGEPLRHEDWVRAASFSPDGRRVVTASRDGTARVWDAQSGKPVGQPLRHEAAVWAASFSPDGQRIVTASDDRTARVWDAQSGKPVGQPLRHESPVASASFSADGQRVVTASRDTTARVWDAQTGEPIGESLRHKDEVPRASFSPDGQRVVTASYDKTARVWDAQSGRPVGEPLRHED